jgi:hypothetical protein
MYFTQTSTLNAQSLTLFKQTLTLNAQGLT